MATTTVAALSPVEPLGVETTTAPNSNNCQRKINVSAHEKWRIALCYCYVDIPNVEEHVNFQRDLCQRMGFRGRIRVSSEGINVVLSGLYSLLQEYETLVTQELQRSSIDDNDDNASNDVIYLDVKYCLLRTDLSIESQLFENLMVKETKTVISLCDSAESAVSKKQSSNGRRNNNRRRRRRQRPSSQENEEELNEQQQFIKQWEQVLQQQPSPHLSAKEWNDKLDQAGRDSAASTTNKALLLDVRNVYESRVGHFVTPEVPCLLTNTRKYSDLPQLLASNEHVQESEQIFMYCTGGVRCERVSQLVQTMYPTKQVYQLQGGIQTYLREITEQESESSNNSDIATRSKFRGKNFVFDPRRTDPVHAGTTVGQCLICHTTHDDYDNGHAPRENKEARCNTCRMLILVCNDCRPNYVCWGEENKEEAKNSRPLLYCGGTDRCVHEGSAPAPELVREEGVQSS